MATERPGKAAALRFVLLFVIFGVGLSPLQGQVSSPPADLAADLQGGEAALKANNQTAAAKHFQEALKRDPTNLEAHANLGAIAFLRGDCAAAETNFRAALQVSPGLTKVQALLSICERRAGEPSGQADMESAFAKLADPKLRTQIGLELANGYYQQGDLEKTAATLHTLLSSNPEDVDVLFFAQRVYSELADTTLNKLAVLSPNSARMEQLIAERLINGGDLKNATFHYRKALQLGPRLPGLHFELAEALMEGSPYNPGAQTEAKAELEAAIQSDGDSSKVECELGRVALLQSDPAQAFSHYQHAYALDPTNVQAQVGLADMYRAQDKPEEAATYLRMAIKGDPFNAEAHYKLSQVDKQLHLDQEQKAEMQLFLDIRSTKDKVKLLYQQMKPQAASDDAIISPK